MKNFTQSLLLLWKQLGLNQRVSLIVAAVAVAGGLAGVVLWSQRPDYQLLYARMGDKDSAGVIGHLQTLNIPHQVTAGGTGVMVPTNMVHKIRMDLASKGLPSGDGVGFEIFDKGQFGLSDFVQRTNYLRAVQGELSRTIMQLAGVKAARVMIVQPENRLLLTENGVKSTASVFVDVGGGRLESDQVNAIRHLVANAVQGLAPDHVAVVDNRGRTLSEELKQDPLLGSANSQMRYRQQVEDYYSKKVESMLASVIGPGNAVVRVAAEIESEATTQTSEKYDPDGQVVRSQTQTEDITNSTEARSGGGATGVSANVPEKAGTTSSSGSDARPTSISEQNRKNRTTTYEINRVTTNTTRNPGTVKSLTAAVFITPRTVPGAPGADGKPAAPQEQKRTQQELDSLRQIVINALGLKPVAGQPLDALVSLQETAFQGIDPQLAQIEAVRSSAGGIQTYVEMANHWVGFAGAAIVLLVFWRMLKKQQPEAMPIEVLSLSPESGGGSGRTLPNGTNITPEMLNELIKQKPANVGVALRDWVAAGAAPAGKN